MTSVEEDGVVGMVELFSTKCSSSSSLLVVLMCSLSSGWYVAVSFAGFGDTAWQNCGFVLCNGGVGSDDDKVNSWVASCPADCVVKVFAFGCTAVVVVIFTVMRLR